MTQDIPKDEQDRGDCAESAPDPSKGDRLSAHYGAFGMLEEITKLFRETTPPDGAQGEYVASVLARAKTRVPQVAAAAVEDVAFSRMMLS